MLTFSFSRCLECWYLRGARRSTWKRLRDGSCPSGLSLDYCCSCRIDHLCAPRYDYPSSSSSECDDNDAEKPRRRQRRPGYTTDPTAIEPLCRCHMLNYERERRVAKSRKQAHAAIMEWLLVVKSLRRDSTLMPWDIAYKVAGYVYATRDKCSIWCRR